MKFSTGIAILVVALLTSAAVISFAILMCWHPIYNLVPLRHR